MCGGNNQIEVTDDDINSSNLTSTITSIKTTETTVMVDKYLVDNYEILPESLVRIVTKKIKTEYVNGKKVDIESGGSGSGFFVTSDGYIVTNNHVTAGAITIEVNTQFRSIPFSGKLIGQSECEDVSVIKIPNTENYYLSYASEPPKLGQNIIAAGFPKGDVEVTYLNGIVSKEETNGDTYWSSLDYRFEHTAEILPGSSGGPIVDENAKVIGIAYAGNVDRQEYGIPINLVDKTINKIIKKEFVPTFNADLEQYEGLGIYIYSTAPSSPLRYSGLEGGEVITHINKIDITNETTLKIYCDIIQNTSSTSPVKFEGYNPITNKSFSIDVSMKLNSSIEATPETPTTTTTTPTTTTTTPTTTTTTVDSIIKDSSLLNFSDIMNEFPEIPYCKYQYDEVAHEINKHFQNQGIRLTIREMLVETDNTDCHGLVSGSNFSFKNTVQDGDFVEITVESTKTLRIFPTYIANSPNAKGNNERWNLYCDLTGDGYLERDWMGEFSGNASDVYFYYGLYTNLNDPNTNCVAEPMVQKLCYWGYGRIDSGDPGGQIVSGGGSVVQLYYNVFKPIPENFDKSKVIYSCSIEEMENIIQGS